MSATRSICDNKTIVYLLSVLAIVLWGMSYIWSDRLIAQNVPIFYFVPIRIFLAGIILLVFNIITKALRPIARKDIWKFLLLALFEPLIYFLCETYGIKETGSPTISAMIIASVPIFSVGAGALFFKERISILNGFGIAVTLGGICLVLLTQGGDEGVPQNFVLGVILLMIAVFSEVGHASLTKLLADGYKPQVIVMYQFLIGSVYFLPFFLTKGIENFDTRLLSWNVLEPILCLAVLCSSLAFSLWAMTIKKLGVGKSSVFLAMMCVATALVAEVIGREHLSIFQWLGVFVAVLGIVLSQYCCTKKSKIQ